MNAIEQTKWSSSFQTLGRDMPRPRAILAISAHWYVDGTYVTAQAQPPTIHDFSGFPRALYEIQYPAPGLPDLGEQVSRMIDAEARPAAAGRMRHDWGLDHGTWSVLRWMYPDADVPVLQLSIDHRLSMAQHLDLGRSLASLRQEGVLLLGSGNIVHNLRDAFGRMRSGESETPVWAQRFDSTVRDAISQHDLDALTRAYPDHPDAQRAHPSPDHWIPLLYIMGASQRDERVAFPAEGFDVGSISMRSVVLGSQA